MSKGRMEAFSDGVATAVGKDFKGKISVVLCIMAISFAFVNSWFACAIYVAVAIIWLVPDRRIERIIPR